MIQNQNGSKAYLISIVMVAVLGGLLFGYDTAVISGAEVRFLVSLLLVWDVSVRCSLLVFCSLSPP